jgi:hypothetical protein
VTIVDRQGDIVKRGAPVSTFFTNAQDKAGDKVAFCGRLTAQLLVNSWARRPFPRCLHPPYRLAALTCRPGCRGVIGLFIAVVSLLSYTLLPLAAGGCSVVRGLSATVFDREQEYSKG